VDPFTISLWLIRLGFLALLYLFLLFVARGLWRDLRGAASAAERSLGRLVVLASPGPPAPEVGAVFPLEALNRIGRDVNNGIVVDDAFASAEHALLTYRGRTWYVEDLASTNGTWINGRQVEGSAPIRYGDELQVGQVRLRLDRPRNP
jgi:pSer/pThr/pTyr-binding forkhead associated (FHA) protein